MKDSFAVARSRSVMRTVCGILLTEGIELKHQNEKESAEIHCICDYAEKPIASRKNNSGSNAYL